MQPESTLQLPHFRPAIKRVGNCPSNFSILARPTRARQSRCPSIFCVTICSLFTAGFIQMAMGITCYSDCAACWKDDGSPGEDIKFSCDANSDYDCGDQCPTSYSDIHCARDYRCYCIPALEFCSQVFGPCACGQHGYGCNDNSCFRTWQHCAERGSRNSALHVARKIVIRYVITNCRRPDHKVDSIL